MRGETSSSPFRLALPLPSCQRELQSCLCALTAPCAFGTGTGMRIRQYVVLSIMTVIGFVGSTAMLSMAIELQPSPAQVRTAVERGKEAAAQHRAPDSLYVRFGAADDKHTSGFLLTKLGAVSVMATHMALRGIEPSAADLAQMTEASTMQISVVIFGESPSFAVESYMVLDQGGTVVKPITVRVDGQASRSSAWPESQKFQAKVVATFRYIEFNPNAQTTITVFPASGGEVSFSVDFAQIE